MLKNENNPVRFKLLMEKIRSSYILFLLLPITFFVYKGLLSAEFLDYDDGVNIVQNQWIKGFSAQNLRAVFTTSFQYSYNPVTFLFYMLEYQMFGINPTGFHLVNIILHLANTLLVFRLVSMLSKKRSIAFVAAALFALHPMQADVIGWASAQNYLLATLFSLSSLIFYIHFLNTSSSKTKWVMLSLFFFILACLSKSQAVTLAVLIIPLNWLFKAKYDRKLLIIVSIYFIIAAAAGLLTIYFRADMGKTEIIPSYSFIEKTCVICFSLISYVFKTVYPFGLTAIESFPAITDKGHLPLIVYLSPLILMIAGILSVGFFKKAPLAFFGLIFFFLNLMIAQLSFLEDGFSANRYFYLSSVGIFLSLAWLIILIYDKIRQVYKTALLTAGMAVLIIMTIQTHARSKTWQNTYTLTSSIIERSPGVAMAYNIRGIWQYHQKNYELSLSDLSHAITLFPGYSAAWYNRGLSHSALQDHQAALEDYGKAIGLNPESVSAYLARGVLYLEIAQDFPAALHDFGQAISLDPGNARAYYNRGLAHFRMRDVENACKDWRKVKSLGYSQADAMLAKYCR
jgi:tetratricopeptide (TPR) repeat protein